MLKSTHKLVPILRLTRHNVDTLAVQIQRRHKEMAVCDSLETLLFPILNKLRDSLQTEGGKENTALSATIRQANKSHPVHWSVVSLLN